jgi:hypothetical protein
MPRYRVKGPDGAIHVFEGPEGATPEQVTAFAEQTFGGMKQVPPQPAAPQQEFGPDDEGVLGSTLIGAGRTFDRVGKGMQQLYYGAKSKLESPDMTSLVTGKTKSQMKLDELAQNAAEDDRLYKPLQEQHSVATAIGESLPSMAIPVGGGATLGATALRLAAAGALPGALEYGSAGDRAGRAALGATAGVVGGVIVPKVVGAAVRAVPAIGRAARAVAEPLTEGGREAIAGRTLNTAAGDAAAAVQQRLANAAELIPGSAPTAGQVAENGGMAALERSVRAANPAQFTARDMEQSAARAAALRTVAQDAPAMKAAEAARNAAAEPLYAQAKSATYGVDPRLKMLLERPSVQKAIARAEKIAEEEGRTFGLTPERVVPGSSIVGANGAPAIASYTVPAKVTGQTLQDLKMAMDAMLKDPTSGIAGKEADLVKATRGQLLNWLEDANPAFKQARTTYAQMSAPINQMQIGSELLDRIAPALADYGALGKETAAKYALALRNAPALAKNATKFPGAKLEDIMTPQQMQLIEGVARDLARKGNMQELGRGVGSDTFQKLSMSNIAERSGAPGVVNGALNLPGVNKVAKFLYSGPDEQIQSLVAQALMDPRRAAALMARSPAMPAGRTTAQMLLANPSRAAQLGGGATGLALGDLFAQ